MEGYVPHPKIDRPLSLLEAIEAVSSMEKYSDEIKMILIEAILNGEVQVWYCWDGKIRLSWR